MSENQKKCFMGNCSNDPIYFCDCGEETTFTCEKHTHFHCELEGYHNYEEIYSEIHEDVRKTALKHFYKLKSNLKEYQSKVIQKELSLINQIHSITQNILQKIKLQNQKFNKYIEQICNIKTIDNSKLLGFIESLLKLTPKDTPRILDIKPPKLVIRDIEYDFKILFNLDDFIEQKLYIEKICRNGSHTIKYNISCKNSTIIIFDAKHLLINNIHLNININLSQYKIKCSFPDGSLFYDNNHSNPFLIDLELHIKSLPHYPKKQFIANAIYFEKEIYVIGGLFTNRSIKYSIDKNKWSLIALFPINSAQDTILAVFKNYILIVSMHHRRIFYYDAIIDSYNEISSLILKNQSYKVILVQNEAVYLFSKPNIYKSIDNLMTWNVVGDCSILNSCLQMTSSPVTYSNKIYFVMTSKIYSFDLENMNLRKVKIK